MLDLLNATAAFERRYLILVLQFTGGKRIKAAKILGISRKCLWQKMQRHELLNDGGVK